MREHRRGARRGARAVDRLPRHVCRRVRLGQRRVRARALRRDERGDARALECAGALGRGAVWVVQRGTRCTHAHRECIAALRGAGYDVRTGGQGARARVEPA